MGRRGEANQLKEMRRLNFLPVSVSPYLRVIVFLLTAHCSLVTAQAQPGVPQPNSPLYGGSMRQGEVATGLPPALKKVGIDQKLNEQVPLDAVFKDEQGREVRLRQFFKRKPGVIGPVYFTCPLRCKQG